MGSRSGNSSWRACATCEAVCGIISDVGGGAVDGTDVVEAVRVVLGELGKWVPASPDRITAIDAQPAALALGLKGAAGEAVALSFLDASSQLVTARCVLPASGVATLTMPAGTCA